MSTYEEGRQQGVEDAVNAMLDFGKTLTSKTSQSILISAIAWVRANT